MRPIPPRTPPTVLKACPLRSPIDCTSGVPLTDYVVFARVSRRAAPLGDYASAVYSICGAHKKDLNQAFLKTCTGELIKVNRAGQTASILMEGVEYPILETLPASARRRMDALSVCGQGCVPWPRPPRPRTPYVIRILWNGTGAYELEPCWQRLIRPTTSSHRLIV